LRRGGTQELSAAGVCLSDPHNAAEIRRLGLPVLGDVFSVDDAIRAMGIRTLVVLPAPEFDAGVLRRMSWTASLQGVDFLLAPVLADVSASRLDVRPINGVPLVQVRAPNLSWVSRLPKTVSYVVSRSLVRSWGGVRGVGLFRTGYGR
jgi:hypothetical protein